MLRKSIFLLALTFVFFACNQESKKEDDKETDKTEESNTQNSDSDSEKEEETKEEEEKSDPVLDKVLGEHTITLQWIDDQGLCTIEEKNDGKLDIYGGVTMKMDDHLIIDGEMEIVNENHLKFNGMIETQVSYVNNGKSCVRDGAYNFKAYKGRKYWRLVEMKNCESGNVVDYIDIHFKK